MYRALAAGAAVAALCTLGTVSTASAAEHAAPAKARAACQTDFMGTGIRIRTAPSVGAAVVGEGNEGDCVTQNGGYVVGDRVDCGDGRSLPDWQNVTDLRTGVTGYVSRCFLIFH